MKTILPLLLLSLLLFCACKKEEGTTDDATPITLTGFPLAIGNKWTYHYLQTNIDSTVTQFFAYDLEWQIVSDTFFNGLTSYRTLQHVYRFNDDPVEYNSAMYFAHNNSRLYKTAIEGSDQFLQFKNEEPVPDITSFIGIPAPAQTNYLEVLSPYAGLIKFPVQPGEVWETNENFSSAIKRQWLGYQTITTKAGTFNCAKLQVIRDYNNDDINDDGYPITYQYFSTKGLIRESSSQQFISGGQLFQRIKSIDLVAVNF